METTTLQGDQLRDAESAERIRRTLEGEFGIARVLARPDRGEVYVKHSAAKMPRKRLVERVAEEGVTVQIKGR